MSDLNSYCKIPGTKLSPTGKKKKKKKKNCYVLEESPLIIHNITLLRFNKIEQVMFPFGDIFN